MSKLPSSFASLYRLFLRASSASVLHQNAAKKQLRRLFRPMFDTAALAIGDLQRSQLSHSERVGHEQFLRTFQQRMDGTLSFLLNCAQHRGIPHRTIYNLNRLRKAHIIWVHEKYYSGSKKWDSKMVVTDDSNPRKPARPRDIERMAKNRMHEHSWDALGEVVRMAEGRHSLSLGRLYLKPWTVEKRR